MIRLNVISRISEDKNCFFDLIYAMHQLKERSVTDVTVLFIGDIMTKTLYHDMLKLIGLFDLSDHISFTKQSIRYDDLPVDVKDGYFLNFTIGNFKGYSGIESIKMGFKTIFYNADKRLSAETTPSVSQCTDLASLSGLILEIRQDPALMAKVIMDDNTQMKNKFLLSADESLFLRSVLAPV